MCREAVSMENNLDLPETGESERAANDNDMLNRIDRKDRRLLNLLSVETSLPYCQYESESEKVQRQRLSWRTVWEMCQNVEGEKNHHRFEQLDTHQHHQQDHQPKHEQECC